MLVGLRVNKKNLSLRCLAEGPHYSIASHCVVSHSPIIVGVARRRRALVRIVENCTKCLAREVKFGRPVVELVTIRAAAGIGNSARP